MKSREIEEKMKKEKKMILIMKEEIRKRLMIALIPY
jgi:hypothetical protein